MRCTLYEYGRKITHFCDTTINTGLDYCCCCSRPLHKREPFFVAPTTNGTEPSSTGRQTLETLKKASDTRMANSYNSSMLFNRTEVPTTVPYYNLSINIDSTISTTTQRHGGSRGARVVDYATLPIRAKISRHSDKRPASQVADARLLPGHPVPRMHALTTARGPSQ